jgi:O-antigen ligase
MNVRALRQFPSVVLMSGFFAIFASSLDQYLNAIGALPFLNVWLFLWGLAAITMSTVLSAMASRRERARLITFYRMNVAVLAPLAAVVLGSFASAFIPTAKLDEGPRYVLYPAYNATVVLLSMLLPFPEHHRKWIRWYLGVAFVLAAGSVFVDVIRPATFSILPDRAAGFVRNPNGAGFQLVALCCALIVFDRVRAIDLAVLAATALGVIATLSRGGIILLAFVVCCYVPCVVRDAARRGARVIVTRLVALVLLIGATYAGTTSLINQRMFSGGGSRVEMLLGKRKVVGPRENRVELLERGWEMVRESPWLGYGSGFTYTLPGGTHNMYVSRWLENGLVGVVSYVWLLAAACLVFWRRRYLPGLVFTGVVVIEGIFSHNLFEERAFLLLLGVLLSLSAFGARERAVTPQRARRVWTSLGIVERGVGAASEAPAALSSVRSPYSR